MTQRTWQSQATQRSKTRGGWDMKEGSREEVGRGALIWASIKTALIFISFIRHLKKNDSGT